MTPRMSGSRAARRQGLTRENELLPSFVRLPGEVTKSFDVYRLSSPAGGDLHFIHGGGWAPVRAGIIPALNLRDGVAQG